MIVAIGSIDLHFPEAHCLKDKRRILKSLIDRVRARFNCSIAEVEHMDMWQRSLVGVAIVGNDKQLLMQMGQRIEEILQDDALVRAMSIEWEYC